MKQALFVEASPVETSASRKVARTLEERMRLLYPDMRIVHRDLAREPVPHLDDGAVRALRGGGNAAPLSDALIDELLASDVLILATPMWNFGVPSSLKAWIDHVVRAGRTFNYTEQGPVGHLRGKKAIVIVASGGVYSAGPTQALDFVVPYLEAVLRFIGIQDVKVIRVEGTGSPKHATQAVESAQLHAQAVTLDPV